MQEDTNSQLGEEAARRAEIEALEPITYEAMNAVFNKWLLLPDQGALKFHIAAYLSNLINGRDPVWTMTVGASGAGKTEMLMAFSELPTSYVISTITPQTLLSGMPGAKDASLLPKISGKILIFKDWTSLLSINKDARAEIMGQFREVYDGEMKKPFGNGKIAQWKGKIGFMAGTTEMVDLAQQMHTTLGERFLFYRLITPDRKEVARRVFKNTSLQEQMRKEMKNAVCAFMKGLDYSHADVPLSEENQSLLIDLTNLTTMARSGVVRDFGMKKEVLFVPSVEMPTRLLQQLDSLARGLQVINKGPLTDIDFKILAKINLDSIPKTNRIVMLELARKNTQTTKEVAMTIGYPTNTIRIYLENLAMQGVIKRLSAGETDEGGSGDRWTLSEEFRNLICTYEKIERELEQAEAEAIEKEFGGDNLPI